VEGLGLLCFVYTSFNHGKTGLELRRDDVLRKLDLSRDPTDEEIRVFLRDHDKHRYEESFIAGCTIKAQKEQTTEGVKIILDTPPLDKFRLIFPLAEPVKLIDLADTQQAALDLWEDKITGLARNTLGVHFDTSCTDPSRLFYTARHPKGADWYAAIIMGNPLAFDSIKPMRKAAYTGNRDSNAFTQAGGETEGNRPPECMAPSGMSLNDWHRHAKDRFMVANLLETLCPDKIRVAGGEAQGHVHVECPFEHEHTSEGGTATMAVNCADSQSEYWSMWCHHDSCQGRHKLQFLEEALRQGWFDESALTDLDQGFLLEYEGDGPDPLAPIPAELDDAEMTPVQRAAQLTREHDEETIRKFIKKLWREGADKTVRGNVNDVIAKNTALTKHDLKPIWKELDAEGRKTTQEGEFPEGILTTAPAPELTQYAADAVKAANEKTPFLFEYMEEPTIVRRGRIQALDRPGKRHALSKVAVFQKPKGEGELQHVYPPYDVVDDLFSSDLSDFCLPLRGAVDTPFFAAVADVSGQRNGAGPRQRCTQCRTGSGGRTLHCGGMPCRLSAGRSDATGYHGTGFYAVRRPCRGQYDGVYSSAFCPEHDPRPDAGSYREQARTGDRGRFSGGRLHDHRRRYARARVGHACQERRTWKDAFSGASGRRTDHLL
jgi:hypothetical protein